MISTLVLLPVVVFAVCPDQNHQEGSFVLGQRFLNLGCFVRQTGEATIVSNAVTLPDFIKMDLEGLTTFKADTLYILQ